jgi:hypothetical protein
MLPDIVGSMLYQQYHRRPAHKHARRERNAAGLPLWNPGIGRESPARLAIHSQ